MLDQAKNFVKAKVTNGYASDDTAIQVASGQGAKFPDPSIAQYNLTWWDAKAYPDPSDDPNREIVRVTARVNDILTVIRGQEGVGATSKNTVGGSYYFILAPTAKMIGDIDTSLTSLQSQIDAAVATQINSLLKSNNLSDLANAGTARTNLGLGTLATQNGTFSGTHSGTSSGTNTGDQDLSGLAVKSNNLSDLTNKATARTNLGVQIGLDVQAYSATLASWAGKTVPTGAVLGTTDTQTVTNKDLTSGTNTFPTLNQNTTGSAAKWTTARLLAGNSTNGSANVPFANKFIVQGTADSGLSGAQFLGTLGTGLIKNTTTTGVLSLATPGTDYEVPITFSTGLTRTTNTVTVNTTQNIAKLSNLSTNGLLKTTGGDGTLAIATAGTDYMSASTGQFKTSVTVGDSNADYLVSNYTDLASAVNAAAASLPSTGGIIQMLAGSWSSATTISLNTSNKLVCLQGMGAATTLTYTGTGNAILLDQWGFTRLPQYYALRNFILKGSDNTITSTQVGLYAGGTIGPTFATIDAVEITHFGTGTIMGQNAFTMVYQNMTFETNYQHVHINAYSNSGESVRFDNVFFHHPTKKADAFYIESGGIASLTCLSCSFDDTQIRIKSGNLGASFIACHYEDPDGSAYATSDDYFVIDTDTNTNVIVNGGTFWNSQPTRTPSQFITNGARLTLNGVTFASDAAHPSVPVAVNLNGTGRMWWTGILNSGTAVTNLVTTLAGDLPVSLSGYTDANGRGTQLLTNDATILTNATSQGFAVGPNGATNPVFAVDTSVASQADGISVSGKASGSGTVITATSSGANAGIVLKSIGTGAAALDSTSTTGSTEMRINGTSRWKATSVGMVGLGQINITDVASSSSTTRFLFTGTADTNLVGNSQSVDFNIAQTRTWASNTSFATQVAVRFRQPTYNFATAGGVITTAETVRIDGAPLPGPNAAITNAYALHVISGLTGLAPSTTTVAGLNIPSGTAPTSPSDGDVWYDGSHLYYRIGFTTTQLDNQVGSTYIAGTGLTLTGSTFSVNTSQNIVKLSNLTTNGFVKTSAADGTLIVDTSTYLTANQTITLSGDISGSGTTAITTAIGAGKVTNTMLAGSIAYSKLSLTGAIVNADVSASAAIAYSKLALTGSILNADLAGSIANSKLSNSTISGIALGGTLGALTATNSSLTFSGSYTGAAAQTVGINYGATGTWTGTQTYALGKLLDKGSMVFDVRGYGAVCDGSTNDQTAVQNAINAAGTLGGGVVLFPIATTMVQNLTVPDGVTLRGLGKGYPPNGSCIMRHTSSTTSAPLIDCSGASSAARIDDIHIENIVIHGNDFAGAYTGDLVRCYYIGKMRFTNVFFTAVTGGGSAIHGVEFWDSRFDNCRFEYCGNATSPSVLLQNMSATSGFGFSNDNTNQIYFDACVWEANQAVCLKCDSATGGGSNVVNGIYVDRCKFESDKFIDPFIVTDTNTTFFFARDLYLAADHNPAGYVGGTKPLISSGGQNSLWENLFMYQNSAITSYGIYFTSTSWKTNTVSHVVTDWNGTAPSSGYTVGIDAAAGQNITVMDVHPSIGGATIDNSGAAFLMDSLKQWSTKTAPTGTVVGTTDTQTLSSKTLTSAVLNGTVSGTSVATAATASTLALRDTSGNIAVVNMLEGFTTTATAAGTTTLVVGSTYNQVFTGSTTQTVKLPTTSVVTGQQYLIQNASTGAVTVQSSGANTITILAAGTSAIFTALVATPTTAANWSAQYFADIIASGKKLSISNSLTFAGTDATTMTFPTTSATIARTDAAQTFTGLQTFSTGITSTLTGATANQFSGQAKFGFNSTTVPAIYAGDGTDASSWLLTAAGGRAMYGYTTADSNANEVMVFNAGSGKGISFYVNGTNSTFLSGTNVFSLMPDLSIRMSQLANAGGQAIVADTNGALSNKPAVVQLASVSGINSKATGATALFTVPAGKTAIILHTVVRVTAAVAITVPASADVGVTAGDIAANTSMTGTLAAGKAYVFNTAGGFSTAAAAAVVNFTINTASTGTSQTLSVEIYGYLE